MDEDRYDRLDRNGEGYPDPTAGAALKKIVREEQEAAARARRPPLGVTPYYIAAQNRIKELAQAIQRYSHEKNGHKRIEGWAAEIVEQCILISRMNGEEDSK